MQNGHRRFHFKTVIRCKTLNSKFGNTLSELIFKKKIWITLYYRNVVSQRYQTNL